MYYVHSHEIPKIHIFIKCDFPSLVVYQTHICLFTCYCLYLFFVIYLLFVFVTYLHDSFMIVIDYDNYPFFFFTCP